MLYYSKAGIEFHMYSMPSLLFCELNEQPGIMALGRWSICEQESAELSVHCTFRSFLLFHPILVAKWSVFMGGAIQQTNKQILTGNHVLNSTVFFYNLQFTNICHVTSWNTLQQYLYCTVLFCTAMDYTAWPCTALGTLQCTQFTVLFYTLHVDGQGVLHSCQVWLNVYFRWQLW